VSRLNITAQLAAAFTLPLAFLVFLGGFAIFQFSEMQRAKNLVVEVTSTRQGA